MIFGAILAGGVGSRMNISSQPKQFLDLGDKPILIHTIEKFLMCEKFDFVYVGIHSDWLTYTEDLVKKYIGETDKIRLSVGGKDRNSTIFNIIDDIEKSFSEDIDNSIIVTHDSVRPFVSLEMINENIEAAKKYGAVDTVAIAVDTIVKSKDGNFISEIPERKEMYQGQTPQSFKIGLLKKLYNELSEEEKLTLTDACKVFVIRNKPVYMVNGDVSNLKITTVSDYKIAQAMLGGKVID